MSRIAASQGDRLGIALLLPRVVAPVCMCPPAVSEDAGLPTSELTLGITDLPDFCPPREGGVVSRGFDVHFPEGHYCRASFCVLMGHLSHRLLKLFCLIEKYLGYVSFDKCLK